MAAAAKASKDNLLQIWEKLVELHIFHDDVKQERLRTFMLIEAVIMIGFAIVLTQVFGATLILPQFVFMVLGASLCFMGFTLARRTENMDLRTADYVRTIKNQLRNIEAKMKPMLNGVEVLPYEGQFKVLNEHSLRLDATGTYNEFPRLTKKQSSRRLVAHQPATHHERLIIRVTGYAWAAAFLCMVGVMVVMLTPDWHIAMVKLSQHTAV